jgi:hypothetical protein
LTDERLCLAKKELTEKIKNNHPEHPVNPVKNGAVSKVFSFQIFNSQFLILNS